MFTQWARKKERAPRLNLNWNNKTSHKNHSYPKFSHTLPNTSIRKFPFWLRLRGYSINRYMSSEDPSSTPAVKRCFISTKSLFIFTHLFMNVLKIFDVSRQIKSRVIVLRTKINCLTDTKWNLEETVAVVLFTKIKMECFALSKYCNESYSQIEIYIYNILRTITI